MIPPDDRAVFELQEEIARHEAEIASCLGTNAAVEDRLSRLEAELTRLGALVKSEQLYRQGQEFINTEDITKGCVLGLSLLKESAALGHGDAAFACDCHLERGLICEENQAEAKRYFDLSATLGNTSGLTASNFRFAGRDAFPADRSGAVGKVKRSAHRGNALGQFVYGAFLMEGQGVANNETPAVGNGLGGQEEDAERKRIPSQIDGFGILGVSLQSHFPG